MLRVSRLDGNFGVEVIGFDAREPMDRRVAEELTLALYANRVVVIRDQRLTEPEYLEFGRQWGRPHPHVLDHKRMPGFPEMMTIGNTFKRAANDPVAAFWHTDQSYETEPASCTMLYSILAPEAGGETLFVDMVAAYQALDAATQRRVSELEAMHYYGAASGMDGENRASAMISESQRKAAPPVGHGLVRQHPVSGHLALYAVAGTPFAIRGVADDEARVLLKELKRHATEGRFVYKHKYRVGDIAIWDTMSTLHSATPIAPATCSADSRKLWRISCKGLPKVWEQRQTRTSAPPAKQPAA